MNIFSELIGAQLENKDGDYSHNANQKGRIWFNRVANKVKASYNGVVEMLATESYVDDLFTNLKDNGLLTLEQASKPDSPDIGRRKVYAKDDGIYELGSDDSEHKLERTTKQKVRDVSFVEINSQWNQSSTVTRTLYTADGDYKWSFVGSCMNIGTLGETYYSNPVNFDGRKFNTYNAPTDSYLLNNNNVNDTLPSSEYQGLKIPLVGSGSFTNGQSLSLQFLDVYRMSYGEVTGLLTLYKMEQ